MATHDPQQAAPRGRMLEYAEFVEDQVARACSRIKNNDMFRATLWLVTVGLAVLFVEIVLDHTVELPLVARRAVFYGGLIVAAIYAGLRIVRPMFLRVNDLYAAKSIESVDPHFKNSLINYLRLREDADKIPPSVLKSIEARAVNDLTAVNVDDVVDPSPVTRLSYALAAIVVGLCLYSWITPKNIWDSARRAFLADVARPTNTRFANVSPGDDPEAPKVITGLPVNFSVETLGAQPDTVTLHTSRDGGKSFAETPMIKGRSFADPWTATIEKAPGEMHYFMAGGDGRTRTYRLEALPVALVESVTLDYDFPAYAKAPRREGVTDGNVEALQGTRVTVTATTNQPARSGLLDFGPRPPVALVPLPGEPKKLKGTFVVEANGQYSVRFNTLDGQTNPEPVLYDIRVVKDVPPTARFIRPESPTQRPANARVPLVIEASDDFGITSALLHVYKGGEILQQAVELIDPKAKEAVKQIQTTIALDLEPLSLRDGDRIQYWLALKDNCEIQTNRFETPKQEIVIQPPVTQPERDQLAQNEMAQAREELGQQEPQPEDRTGGQQGQDSQSGEGQKEQENQGENKSGERNRPGEEEKKSEQGKEGQGKQGQGTESESAEPGENAKSGGAQGKGQQRPSDDSAQSKDSQGQQGQGGEASKSSRQPDGKSGQGQSGGTDPSKGERSPMTEKSNDAGKASSPDRPKEGEKGSEPAGEKGEQGKQDQPGGQEKGEGQPGERPEGSRETGKAEPGRQPDATERSTSKSGEGTKGERKKGEPGEKSVQDEGADRGKSAEGQQGEPGADAKKAEGEPGEREGLPKGEAQEGERNENAPQKSIDDLTQQDRDKLDRLRKALGMDDQPKGEENRPEPRDQPRQSEASKSEGEPGKESGGQEKGEPGKESGGQEKGEPGKESGGQEKGEPAKSGGQEKGEPGKESGGQEKGEPGKDSGGQEKGEPGKESGGQEKGEPGKESGGQEKGEPGKESGGQEKGESSKSGGQEKGEPGKESGGQEKGEPAKSGGQEKGESSKSGGQEKGESSKSGGQEKGEASKSGGQEKGESGGQEKGESSKSGGQDKGESSKSGGQEKGESGQEKGEAGKSKGEPGKQGNQPSEGGEPKGEGESKEGEGEKSKDEGEQKGQPGGLPDGAPKNGGMRKDTGGPKEKTDTTEPSPRAIEPENQTREDLSPQRKADQRLLNRLRQMVEKNEITKEIEQATGLSREEIDQFVRQYEAPAEDRRTREGGEAGEIVSGPGGDDRERRVTLPGETPDGKVLSRTGRGSGMVRDDEMRGNLEGARSRVPSALRSRFEAYQKALSRTPGSGGSPAPAGSAEPSGGGTGAGSGTNRR